MKHKVALSGSYSGGNTERLFDQLTCNGVLQLCLIGREVTLQVNSEKLDEIKKLLAKLGVENISMLEWKKTGITVVNAGKGTDKTELIGVSLIPSTIDGGVKSLAVLHDSLVDEKMEGKLKEKVEEIICNAGITDVVYSIQVKKTSTEKQYLKAAELAALNALFEAGGVTEIKVE